MRLALFIVFALSCSLGLLYFFGLLKCIIFSKKDKFCKYCEVNIISVSGHLENIEYLVRKSLNTLKHENPSQKKELIFLDKGLDWETRVILNKLCQAHNFTICGKDEFYDIIREKL